MRKLLIFDLDDTLLTSEKIITPSSIKAIEACKNNGMVIGYITGRARTMQNEIDNGKIFFTDRYNLPKDFIAYYNGAEIYAENISIERNIIPHKNAMKESALKKASEYFNIPFADIISFGDDINDMNMLKTSGVGVAMGNAINAVKEAADYITETNDNEGISVWINKYLLGNKA